MIQSDKQPRIADVIARRRARAVTRQGYRSLLFRVLFLGAAVYLLFTFGFLITQNSGQHMFPAMKDGDLCIVFRKEAHQLLGQRFVKNDIIAYQAEGKRHFGRVVAVGGDIVMISDSGSLAVNSGADSGEILFPTYARGELEYPYRVPDGCLFVLGDYRTNTVDSRDLGPIPLESVEGKVISILRRRGL